MVLLFYRRKVSNRRKAAPSWAVGNYPQPFKHRALGTHYVPVTIHPTYFKNVFKDETNTQASAAYHPISIPINFCGPNVSIHPHADQQLIFASERQKEETYSEHS